MIRFHRHCLLAVSLSALLLACPPLAAPEDAGSADGSFAPPDAGSRPDGGQPPGADGGQDAGRPDPAAVHLVGYGDSVTAGYCASNGRSYFQLLVRNLDAVYPAQAGKDLERHFTTVTADNLAVSGATSCDLAARRAELVNHLRRTPVTAAQTVVVITLGGNDLIHDYGCLNPHECAAYCSTLAQATPWAQAFRQRMIDLIRVFQAELPGKVHVFLANIYDPTDGVGDIERASILLPPWPEGLQIVALYNQTLAEVAADTGAHLVDMRRAMLGHGIHYTDTSNPYYDPADPTYWYCSNLEDPNDRGYHAIRRAFWDSIATELGL